MNSKRYAHSALMVAAALMAVCAYGATPTDESPLGTVQLTVKPSNYSGGGCPVEVEFTAKIDFTMPHPESFVIYCHWERSNGVRTEDRKVRVEPSQQSMVFNDTWQIGTPGRQYKIRNAFLVDSGPKHLVKASPVIPIACK